tara:strand:+ start:547 stop:966 length:420 start_codon:yes stop_codon:yes gene_type:complete
MILELLESKEVRENYLNYIEEEYGLYNVLDFDMDIDDLKEYIINQSWMFTFRNDADDKDYALLILEWTGDRVASLHITLFNRGNIYKGWNMFLAEYSQYFDELEVVIPPDRSDVARLAKGLGFSLSNDGGYLYGKRFFV